MVYDCFQFFNELDILKLRMHVLNLFRGEKAVIFPGKPGNVPGV